MKLTGVFAVVGLAISVVGCSRAEDTQAYSAELSREMPKSQTSKPDFAPPKGFIIGTGAKTGAKSGQ